MKDQYDQDIPGDLVVLDQKPAELSEAELCCIDRLEWYRPANYPFLILVSYGALCQCIEGVFDETDPADCGVDGALGPIERIADCLHRWSAEDGFYHA